MANAVKLDLDTLAELATIDHIIAKVAHRVDNDEDAVTITWHTDEQIGSFAFAVDKDGVAWVGGMGIAAKYRQRGIYTNLCEKFPAWGRANGLKRMNIIALDLAAEIFSKSAFEPGEFEGQYTVEFTEDMKGERYAAAKKAG